MRSPWFAPLFGLSSFLHLSFRDCGCGKAMSFDDLFRKDRPNKILQLIPGRLVTNHTPFLPSD